MEREAPRGEKGTHKSIRYVMVWFDLPAPRSLEDSNISSVDVLRLRSFSFAGPGEDAGPTEEGIALGSFYHYRFRVHFSRVHSIEPERWLRASGCEKLTVSSLGFD